MGGKNIHEIHTNQQKKSQYVLQIAAIYAAILYWNENI